MATIEEIEAQCRYLRQQGRGGEKAHLVLIEVEARERIKNPKAKTRFSLETDDPKLYSRFNELKDRWFSVANKSVALTVMFSLWDRPIPWIKEICDQEGQRSHDSPTL